MCLATVCAGCIITAIILALFAVVHCPRLGTLAAALKDDAENHRDFSAPVMDDIYIYRHQAASEIRITS